MRLSLYIRMHGQPKLFIWGCIDWKRQDPCPELCGVNVVSKATYLFYPPRLTGDPFSSSSWPHLQVLSTSISIPTVSIPSSPSRLHPKLFGLDFKMLPLRPWRKKTVSSLKQHKIQQGRNEKSNLSMSMFICLDLVQSHFCKSNIFELHIVSQSKSNMK